MTKAFDFFTCKEILSSCRSIKSIHTFEGLTSIIQHVNKKDAVGIIS